MPEGFLKRFSALLLIACGVCLFIAVERYQANANAVALMNQIVLVHLSPVTPVATKYALLFAVIFGGCGIVGFLQRNKPIANATA